jgi:hypothetical protein
MLKSKTLTGIFIFACILMTSSVLSAATVTYTYDSLNRLTMVYGNGTTEKYTYDTAGNRLTYVSFISDTTPDQFSFNSLSDVALNTLAESNAITVAGINTPASISVSGGEYSVSTDNGTNWTAFSTSNPSNVEVDTLVKVRQTSSGSYAATTNTILTIGGVSGTFSVTTIADTIPPNPPSVTSTTPINNPTPTWTSGGGEGNGTFRYQIDSEAGGWNETAAASYTPESPLSSATHTLYVQERDAAGNWSVSGSKTVLIDTAAPSDGTLTATAGDTQVSLS